MSDKKTLLKEQTIRRFMKLASIDRLSENFLDNQDKPEEELKEDETAEELEEAETDVQKEGMAYDRDVPEDEPLPGDEPGLAPPGEDLPGDEAPVGLDEPGEEVEASVTVPEADVDSLRTARDVIDQVLSAAEGGEGEGELEPPGGEPVLEPGVDDTPVPPVPMAENEDEDGLYEYKESDLVKEVSRRVAKRIKQLGERKKPRIRNKEKMAEKLAESIFRRLTKKKR